MPTHRENSSVKSAITTEMEFLYDIGKLFDSFSSIEDLLNNVLLLLKSKLPMERGMINVHDRETDDIYIDVSLGYSKEEVSRGKYKVGEGIIGRVVDTGRPIVVPSVDSEPLFLNRTGARSGKGDVNIAFICVPIKIEGITIGTISIDLLIPEDAPLDRELNILTAVSIMVSHAVNGRKEMRKREYQLEQENRLLKLRLSSKIKPRTIIGNSPVMHQLIEKVMLVAPTNSTVLITGESGTGKELIAEAVHSHSPRKEKPLIKVNMAALPESLIESELFGHEKGAYTGASSMKKGRFELADGGSIFLDEIGDLGPASQVKLLRVIQEKTIERIGGEKTISLDVRIIAATHRNLEEKIREGRFREDLYYRLNVFPIYAPPLRERKADIMLLADGLLEKYCAEHNRSIRRISSEAIDLLTSYHWPGNVRELENCIERAVIMSGEDVIRSYHLPPSLQTAEASPLPVTFDEMVDQYQREIIIDHLKMTKGNITKAAVMLGTTKRILTYRVRELGIDYSRFR